jgi:O-antigen biosynthesis protein WbqP
MTRAFDVFISLAALLLGMPLFAGLTVLGYLSCRSPIFQQIRIGRHQKPFRLFKFRTMRLGVPSVATHLVSPDVVTPYGQLLRRTKLDELPQLWNVLRGDMSLVGPRPCLPNQFELISERAALGVFDVRPGVTGLAQIRGVDMSTPRLLAQTDAEMIRTFSTMRYFKYILLTAVGHGQGDRVTEDKS